MDAQPRRYEIVFALAPTLNEEEVEQSIENFRKVAEDKGAEIIKVEEWGRRNLAYPIQKHTEGIYTIFTLEEPRAEAVNELARRFKVADSVIRFLTVRVDQDLKRADKLKARREKKKQKKASTKPPSKS